jgi:Tfp pilus assembly protein FimT
MSAPHGDNNVMRVPWQRTASTEPRDGLTPTELLVVVLVLIVALAIAVPVLLNR